MKIIVFSLAFLSLTGLGFAQEKKDFTKVPSMVKEAKEKGNVGLADSLAQDYINNYLFKLRKEEMFTKENLLFMSRFLGNPQSKSFKFFIKDREKINAVLGYYEAQKSIMNYIEKKYLPNNETWKTVKPDWDSLEKTVIAKFGSLGQERVCEQRMLYYWTIEDWKNFSIWYVNFFEKYLKSTRIDPNNLSWSLFEHAQDQSVLKFAAGTVMKYAVEKWDANDWQSYDTYANLLYKTGNKDQAIEWEEKALKLSNNDKGIVETLEKMQRGEKTWKEIVSNP